MNTHINYKDSIRSLRPKEFKRENYVNELLLGDKERFFLNSINTMKTGTLVDIHNHCLLDNFERQTYKVDRKNKLIEQKEHEEMLKTRSDLRNTLLQKHQTLRDTNEQKTTHLIENWKQTQLVKKNRRTHDLQFELAMNRVEELKNLKTKLIHQKTEVEGIDSFETNMKRLGLGGGNDGGETGLSISYETPEAYQDRINKLAKIKLPTNEEVNDFKTQLKDRTAANRQARYEKARRRRKAGLAAAAATSTSEIQPEV